MILWEKTLIISALVLFLIVSCLFISPSQEKASSQYHSSQLEKVVTSDGDTERTDYVNLNGQITIAADKGFATIIVTKVAENSKLEQYYDDQGEPVSRYANSGKTVRLIRTNGALSSVETVRV